ncbi:hypothetical protein WME99_44105 [Sorangium sp. So ce136]|uniref:hypothetical protein n=1 Tax=Sorangium sp. So ce136 TaxID=3133284 RepID=UPI003F08FA2E
MRATRQCPKCGGSKLYVCENRQPDEQSSNTILCFRVATVPVSAKTVGTKQGTPHRTEVGAFQTWICAACGFTEWYALDPEALLGKLAAMPGSGVQVLDTPPPKPYR